MCVSVYNAADTISCFSKFLSHDNFSKKLLGANCSLVTQLSSPLRTRRVKSKARPWSRIGLLLMRVISLDLFSWRILHSRAERWLPVLHLQRSLLLSVHFHGMLRSFVVFSVTGSYVWLFIWHLAVPRWSVKWQQYIFRSQPSSHLG